MKVDTCSGFTEFGIRNRPFAYFFQVLGLRLLTFVVLEIEVDDNMVLRDLDIVKLGRVNIPESSRDLFPGLGRNTRSRCVLSRLVCQNII